MLDRQMDREADRETEIEAEETKTQHRWSLCHAMLHSRMCLDDSYRPGLEHSEVSIEVTCWIV